MTNRINTQQDYTKKEKDITITFGVTMLEYLHIRDFLFIKEATLELHKGLNVLTGESGAGKSFIIKAILFLLGEKINNIFKENATGRPSVEGIFYTKKGELILRREFLVESGRSRFFINGTLTSHEVIHTLCNNLILYTSQHSQQKLLQPAFHTHILDTLANVLPLCAKRDEILQQLRLCKRKEEEITAKYIALDEKRELLLYQQHLIEEIQPEENEETRLEEEKNAWKHDEKARSAIENIANIVHAEGNTSLTHILHSLNKAITELIPYDANMENYSLLIEQFQHCINNIVETLRNITKRLPVYDIEKIESRLFALAQLKRTLRKAATIDLATFAQEIEDTLSFLDACALDLQRINKEELALLAELNAVVATINEQREAFAPKVSNILEGYLRPLGFSDTLHITFAFSETTLWDHTNTLHNKESQTKENTVCTEKKARLLWSPHTGQAPLPLDAIASGGELSRILLALYCVLAENNEQTLIFDEVDTGIGGATLKSVTERMQELAQKQQILLITHWPQMARRADRHFFVEKNITKNTTTTTVKTLTAKERSTELKRMNAE